MRTQLRWLPLVLLFAPTCAFGTPPLTPGTPTSDTTPFDEDAARHKYEAWLLGWYRTGAPTPAPGDEGLLDAYYAPYKALFARHANLPKVSDWPIDPDRGLLVNQTDKSQKELTWVHEGDTTFGDIGVHFNFDHGRWTLLDEKHGNVPTPVLCVPEACYFESPRVWGLKGKPRILNKPGVWLALREHGGNQVIAGILIHRTAPKKPLEDSTFKAWRTRLAERFPLSPPPR